MAGNFALAALLRAPLPCERRALAEGRRRPRVPPPSAFFCLNVQSVVALPLGEVRGILVPLGVLELEVSLGELVAERRLQLAVSVEAAQGVEQVERQLRSVLKII